MIFLARTQARCVPSCACAHAPRLQRRGRGGFNSSRPCHLVLSAPWCAFMLARDPEVSMLHHHLPPRQPSLAIAQVQVVGARR